MSTIAPISTAAPNFTIDPSVSSRTVTKTQGLVAQYTSALKHFGYATFNLSHRPSRLFGPGQDVLTVRGKIGGFEVKIPSNKPDGLSGMFIAAWHKLAPFNLIWPNPPAPPWAPQQS